MKFELPEGVTQADVIAGLRARRYARERFAALRARKQAFPLTTHAKTSTPVVESRLIRKEAIKQYTSPIDFDDLKEDLTEITRCQQKNGGCISGEDAAMLRSIGRTVKRLKDPYDSIRVLEMVTLTLFTGKFESDAVNLFGVLSSAAISLAVKSSSIKTLDFLIDRLKKLTAFIIETQVDPARLPSACYLILARSALEGDSRSLVSRRNKLVEIIDEILDCRFRRDSQSENVQLFATRLRKLRNDAALLSLTVAELISLYAPD